MQIELNVVAAYKGVDDILATVTVTPTGAGAALVEVQQSIDDDGPPDVLFELDAEQLDALARVLCISR